MAVAAPETRHDEIELQEPLTEATTEPPTPLTPSPALTRSQLGALFLTHFLSTWNTRVYEFAAILFTAAAFPDTLFYSSLRGFTTTLAALLLSSRIGSWVHRATNRQTPLLLGISINRSSVIIACFVWLLLLYDIHDVDERDIWPESDRWWLFGVVTFVGLFEKLGGIASMISMEQDWIPVLTEPAFAGPFPLATLSAGMRCIDLVSKLFAPLFVSLIAYKLSYRNSVLVVANMGLVSWGIEMIAANRVWRWTPTLRSSKPALSWQSSSKPAQPENPTVGGRSLSIIQRHFERAAHHQILQFRTYFACEAWIPSMSLALLHVSALSYAATFVTFMLNSGYSVLVIAVARAVGSIAEVSSTFLVPFSIRSLAGTTPARFDTNSQWTLLTEQTTGHVEGKQGSGLTRTGLWAISLQIASLGPVVYALFQLQELQLSDINGELLSTGMVKSDRDVMSIPSGFILGTVLIFVFLSASRLGLSVFELSVRELTRTRVPSSQRASFVVTEMMFVNLFELGQWVFAAIFSDPQDFPVLAVGSIGAIGMSAVMYAGWVRKRRGHLFHFRK